MLVNTLKCCKIPSFSWQHGRDFCENENNIFRIKFFGNFEIYFGLYKENVLEYVELYVV